MRELPEPDGTAEVQTEQLPNGRGYVFDVVDAWSRPLVLAIQKQAYEEGLRDARKVVSAEEIPDTEGIADDAYNFGVLDCVRAIDKLTASQKRDE